jgi:iron complex outermembrane receptor protein
MRSKVGLIALLAGAAVWGTAARAQTADTTAEASTDSGQLQEILVTAEKRVESAQKTPISMSVISAQEIAQKGIADFATLSANDSSLNFSSNGSEGYLTVRGISSHDVTEIGDPAVPIVIDGFTTIRPYTMTTSLYDLQRIEVLRGPQGTLYGRNAEGGLVNIISQKPTSDFGAGGSIELGNYNTKDFTAWINMPVNDMLRFRASASSRNHDGYRLTEGFNGAGNYKVDDEDSNSVRLQADFTPVDKLDIWMLFQSTQIGGRGVGSETIPFVTGITPAPTPADPTPVADISHAMPNLGNPYRFFNYGPQGQDIDDKVYKTQISYAGLPLGITVTYLGGYDNMQWHQDRPVATIFGLPLTTQAAYYQNEYPKTVNHELRFTSDTSRPFIWQAGLYYFEERSTTLDSNLYGNPGASNAFGIIDFHFPIVDTRSHAAFGQASYSINDQNKVTAGVRYSRDTKTRNGTFDIPIIGFFGINEVGESESSKTTYHLGYDWSPTDANLVYAKFDTGYKPGGFTTCNPYDPETVKSGEVGSKNRFLNNTFQFNVAGFYNKYENQQVSALSSSCASGTVVLNAGSSKIYGLETSADAFVTPDDKVDLSLTLLHARFDSFLASPTNGAPTYYAQCYGTSKDGGDGGNCQLSGNMLPQAPNATLSLGYEHTWKLADGRGFNARGEAKYTTKQYFDSFNYPDSEQAGYATINAYLGYSAEKWRVNLYGRNLADKVYLVDAAEVTTGGSAFYRFGYGAPRTFGVHLETSF